MHSLHRKSVFRYAHQTTFWTFLSSTLKLAWQFLWTFLKGYFKNSERRFLLKFENSAAWWSYLLVYLPGGGKVLVHCHAGLSRSATVVTAFIMKTKGWALEQALDFVREKRQSIRPNEALLIFPLLKLHLWCYTMLYTLHFNTQLPRGLAVRISGFHPGGPGSIPGVGTNIF